MSLPHEPKNLIMLIRYSNQSYIKRGFKGASVGPTDKVSNTHPITMCNNHNKNCYQPLIPV